MTVLTRVVRSQWRLLLPLVRLPLHRRFDGTPIAYSRGSRTFMAVLAVALALEGGLTELILRLILPGTIWPWIGLAPHLWGLFWVAGTYAGMVVRPHLLTGTALRVRDGMKAELVIPRAAIRDVRPALHHNMGMSGMLVEGRTATVAHGNATVLVRLDPAAGIEVGGVAITALRLTVDDPAGFAAAVESPVAA